MIERFGETTLAKLTHVHPRTLRQWATTDSDLSSKPRSGYIRLDVLFVLAKLLTDEGFSRQEIERHVVALKGYGSSLPAYGMRFPFVESPSMIRILMHFMGDGFIHPIVGVAKSSCYSNQNARLRDGFVSNLKEIFGDVSTCTKEKLSDRDRLHVSVPKWIAYLLAYFYPDARFGQLRSKLPNIIFSLPRELKVEAVRTLADDDGSVQELCIRFVSGSPALLEDTRRLILDLVRKDDTLSESEKAVLASSISLVRNQKNWYRLDLGFRGFEWYRRTISFSHPEKTRELEFRIKAAQRTKRLDALARDFLVFRELLSGQRTAQEIALGHLIREEYVHESLGYHSAQGRVLKCGKLLRRKKAAARWSLTEDGRKWLQILSLVNRNRTKDFLRKTLPERDYMRYRWLRHEMCSHRRSTICSVDKLQAP